MVAVVLAWDLNTRVGNNAPGKHHPGDHFGPNCCRSNNGERLLSLCSHHRLFLFSTSLKNTKHRSALPGGRQLKVWSPVDHITISYGWRAYIQAVVRTDKRALILTTHRSVPRSPGRLQRALEEWNPESTPLGHGS